MSPRVNHLAALEEEELELDAPQPSAPEVRTRPLKVSAALAPRLYHSLADFCTAAARLTGARVTHVEVIRALVAELAADAQLRDRVVEQLRKRANA